jgi:hypothetical protein
MNYIIIPASEFRTLIVVEVGSMRGNFQQFYGTRVFIIVSDSLVLDLTILSMFDEV